MTDQKQTALHLLALGELQKRLKSEIESRRQQLLQEVDEGDRITVHVEIDGTKVKVGAVIRTEPKTELQVVDAAAHSAWALEHMGDDCITGYRFGDDDAVAAVLREHAPHLVMEVRTPTSQWLHEVLIMAARGDGPIPDGVEPVTGTSTLQVRPDASTASAVIPELWRRGDLNLTEILAIGDGQ